MRQSGIRVVAWMLGVIVCSAPVAAQDDPFADEPVDGEEESAPTEEDAAEQGASEEGSADSDTESGETSEPEAASASGGLSIGVSATSSETGAEAGAQVDAEPAETPHAPAGPNPVVGGSHIRRPILIVDGAAVLPSPINVELQNRDYLQLRRQSSGIAVSDTAAALNVGASGTSQLRLRLQPTLVLLNGRRLVSSPFPGANGDDFADINQIPITLVDRIEFVKGNVSGLYGANAVGGAINIVTRRAFEGVEVELGGQATDGFEQHEADVTVTAGAGNDKTGINGMASFFTRAPLAATDREFIGERTKLTDSLLSYPASFRPVAGGRFVIPDPACQMIVDQQNAGRLRYGVGLETRLPEFGPVPPSGDIRQLTYIPPERIEELIGEYDSTLTAMQPGGPRPENGLLEPDEISTFCTGDFTNHNDLVLDEQRLQLYTTFWHRFTDHFEVFGEAGYYRNANENRAAPSFPVLSGDERLFVPTPFCEDDPTAPCPHRDIPLRPPFSGTGGAPNAQIFVGRVEGNHASGEVQTRTIDVFRGVLGLRGDFEAAGRGSVVETWDWEIAGMFSATRATSKVPDVITDELVRALRACSAETITERQEAGCYNPFFSSVLNNASVNPLGVPGVSPVPNSGGYPTTDTDGDGLQDGGFICDPNDPMRPCPSGFDPQNAGTVNTQQVIDRLTGVATQDVERTLLTVDGVLRGDLFQLGGGPASYAAGGQFRRETLSIDYDSIFNGYGGDSDGDGVPEPGAHGYAFLSGGPDVDAPARSIVGGFAELRLPLLSGLEVQGAGRAEHYQQTGLGIGALGALALRPFALGGGKPAEAVEWLLLRGGYSRGFRAPSLLQMYGIYSTFEEVDFRELETYRPFRAVGNPDLDFETTDTISAGLQWDWKGIHIGVDGWFTKIHDVIATDNPRRLMWDCANRDNMIAFQNFAPFDACPELTISTNSSLVEITVPFDNIGEVETNGVDGIISYTLDTKRRDLGDFGTFVIGVQGTYINSYKILSARALREDYRTVQPAIDATDTSVTQANAFGPGRVPLGTEAEFEAAGERNYDNFAPPIPQLRANIPLIWTFRDHTIGVTARYIGGYHDASENTIEEQGMEVDIDAMTTVDVMYGFAFGDEGWRIKLQVGCINVADADPPPVEGTGLGYEVGVHDPRGRLLYARVGGEF